MNKANLVRCPINACGLFRAFNIEVDNGRYTTSQICCIWYFVPVSTGVATLFGKPINKFQANSFKLADMATEIEAARLLLYKACWLKDHGKAFAKEAAMAKLYCSEVMYRAANHAVQIHGGYGLMEEYNVARFYRDQKLLEIGEGTSEIQRLVISRYLGC